MRIEVDYSRCSGHGICEQLRPEVFEVNDDGELQLHQDTVPSDCEAQVQDAVNQCPTGALSLL